MNAIAALLDKPIFQALGWTLIHFIWQGALVAVVYAGFSILIRRFSANVRYAAACGAMLLMLIAPAATMLAISTGVDNPAREITVGTGLSDQSNKTFELSPTTSMPASQPEIEPAPASQTASLKQWTQERLPRAMPWLLALWFAGVLFLSLRFAGGLVMVHRLKRSETSANVDLWQDKLAETARRLRVSRPVRLCESALVEVPTVIGWLRPLILLPASAMTGLSPVQLEALLAHELAHIRRYDYLVNLLQTSIETLFFYHPAVWWVSTQVRQEREHCCDDLAVVACGDVLTYARALTALEELRGAELQLAVASSGGSLLVRIQRLVRGRPPALYGFESGLSGFISLATILVLLAGAQTALVSRNAKAFVKDAEALTLVPMSPGNAADQTAAEKPSQRVEPRALEEATAQPDVPAPIDQAPAVQEPDDAAPSEAAIQDAQPASSNDFISEMAGAGLTNLTVNQLIALKSNGVTAQFVREMSALMPTGLTVNRVIAMRIHGVTSAFADELKAQGFGKLSADQLIAFRVHGVTTQFVAELKNAGYGNMTANSLVAFRVHGVTPAFIQEMKDLGFPNLSADQLTAFRVHGVTPLFVQAMRSYIRGTLSADDLIGLRVHGVSPEMIKELEIMGLSNLSANQLMAFRIHGVTPGYIKAIQDAGYDRVTPDQLTELRIFGVTPEFIQLVKSRGFTDVTLHQLAELRRLNIVPSAKKN